MKITLTPEQETLVQERVASGGYDSPEAVIARALDVLQEYEETERYRREIRERLGRRIEQLADGEEIDGEAVFAEIQAEIDEVEPPR